MRLECDLNLRASSRHGAAAPLGTLFVVIKRKLSSIQDNMTATSWRHSVNKLQHSMTTLLSVKCRFIVPYD